MIQTPENSNRLLLRQLKKSFPNGKIDENGLNEFISLVNDAYRSNEEERKLYSRAEKLANSELEISNQELQIKNDFLDTFNHGMAHDVKNHTSNIIGLVSMLRKYLARNDISMLRTIIDKLDFSSNQLTAIVQGFLYLSRAEVNIDNQFVNIEKAELINAIQAETYFLTVDKQCSINFTFEFRDLFFSFHVLKIIFVNLISNSIKFSKKNELIKIDASLRQLDGRIELKVEDNGIGMSLEDPNNKIFQLFNRAENSRTVKGTGVGLFLVKKIADRHEGIVDLKSEVNKGTTFTICFPIK